MFTSDHGYNIGHHGVQGKGNATWIAAGLQGPRRANLWDTSLRVPLLIRWPGVTKPGAVISEPVSNVDTFATVLAMLGVEPPAEWKHEGVDFSPLLRGEPMPPREVIFAQYDLHHRGSARMRSARTERWKLVRHFEGDQLDEFYDLAADPGEERNLTPSSASTSKLTADQTRTRADLDAKLQAWMRSIRDPLAASP